MHCSRCEGLMVLMGMGDVVRAGTVKGWRCLLCGEATYKQPEGNWRIHDTKCSTVTRAASLKEIGMEQATLDNPPLTLDELSELLNRHIQNDSIAKVNKDAMQRRLLMPATGQPKTDEEQVSLPMTCGGSL